MQILLANFQIKRIYKYYCSGINMKFNKNTEIGVMIALCLKKKAYGMDIRSFHRLIKKNNFFYCSRIVYYINSKAIIKQCSVETKIIYNLFEEHWYFNLGLIKNNNHIVVIYKDGKVEDIYFIS